MAKAKSGIVNKAGKALRARGRGNMLNASRGVQDVKINKSKAPKMTSSTTTRGARTARQSSTGSVAYQVRKERAALGQIKSGDG